MTDAFTAIASTASAALVAAVVTDLWGTTRNGFRHLFGRDEPDRQEQLDGWLDTTEAAVVRAEPAEREAVARRFAETWAVRIADHLERHPDTERDLRELVDGVRAALPATGTQPVQAIATGSVEQRRVSGSTVANTGVIVGSVSIDRRRPG